MSADTSVNDQVQELETSPEAANEENQEPVERDEFNDPLIDDGQEAVETDKPTDDGKGEKPVLPKGVEKSFARMTRQKAELRGALTQSLRENEMLRAMLAKPLPEREAGEEAWIDAKVERAAVQRELPRVEQQAAATHAAYQEALAADWAAGETEAKAVYSDYDQVVTASKAPIAAHVRESLLESPVGPQIAYHLGKDLDALAYLNASSPREVDRYMARLEAQLQYGAMKPHVTQPKPTAPKPAPIPEAPAGTPKIASRAAVAPAKRLDDLDGDAYLAAYRAKKLADKKARQK